MSNEQSPSLLSDADLWASLRDATSRIRSLEAEKKRIRAFGFVSVGVLVTLSAAFLWQVAAPASASAPEQSLAPKFLRAQAFEVVEPSGRVLTRLGAEGEHPTYPVLSIFGENGKQRIRIGMRREGGSAPSDSAFLALLDERGDMLAELSCGYDDEAALLLRDRSDNNRIRLAVWNGEHPSAEILDKDGKRVWSAP